MLASRHSLLRPLLQGRHATSIQAVQERGMTVLSKQSAEEYKKENYTERMKRTGRPVSPHVTIYAFPVGAISSITNRVTGCALSGVAAGMGLVELTCGSGASLALLQDLGSMPIIAPIGKFGLSFSFIYHYLGAIRHLVWDQVPGILTNDDVEKASWALIGSSVLLSAPLAFV